MKLRECLSKNTLKYSVHIKKGIDTGKNLSSYNWEWAVVEPTYFPISIKNKTVQISLTTLREWILGNENST